MTVTEQKLDLLMKALAYASQQHRDQRRKDVEASPYINHPISLACILTNEVHVSDTEVLCAALLHDTVEDTETTEAELVKHFGSEIAGIVMDVTDDKTKSKAERKLAQIDHAAHISDKAKLVKLADKIANLRDVANNPPLSWSLQRRQEYFDWAKQVIDQLRGVHPELEQLFDAAYQQRPEA